ncbi:hypothetical protein NA57DRAFT_60720 [Rhizodiscina lignyota]|uniref:Zinc finger PHD-type domain-containing protein n=1 Tax=Rhizodiscina lignyota TaxID=1504668 RepID=A0A9P4M5R1_9PEZI|nr:hypothetical protein NA57DRAFT_60720 [Rhizodiscina lignyota]
MPDVQRGGRKRKRANIRFVRNLTQQDIPTTTGPVRAAADDHDMSPVVRNESARDIHLPCPPPESLKAYNFIPLTIEQQEQKYREWRRHGSLHEASCFKCGRPEAPKKCYTCRRVYHEKCLSRHIPQHTFDNKFYCGTCLDRQWHVNPPPLTPPASPPPEAATEVQRGQTMSVTEEIRDSTPSSHFLSAQRPSSALKGGTVSSDAQRTNHRFIISDLRDWDPAAHNTHGIERTQSSNGSHALSSLPQYLDTSREEPNFQPGSSNNNSKSQGQRSRFSTLAPEVDNAISVILRELEYSAASQRRSAELDALVVKLQQEAEIRKNDMLLAQRATVADRERNADSSAETERLKSQIEAMGQELREKDRLLYDSRMELERLQGEVEKWKADTDSKEKELTEWKDRLKSLLSGDI